MNFTAIDFETANADRSSVCAIGIVIVKNGVIKEKASWLVRPYELYFDPYNVMIHGITENDVRDKPDFPKLWPEIKQYLVGGFLIAHNAMFDMSVLRHTLDEGDIPYPQTDYSCTRIIAQKHWPGLINYSLPTIASHLGIAFKHHDPLDDAIVCAEIAVKACIDNNAFCLNELSTKLDFINGQLFDDGYRPARLRRKHKLKPSELAPTTDMFDEDHPFYGKSLVFTGTLQSMVRKDAMQRVLDVGGNCLSGVTETADFLVMGDQDFRKFADGKSSNKTKKAQLLLEKGIKIEIISEKEFIEMLVS